MNVSTPAFEASREAAIKASKEAFAGLVKGARAFPWNEIPPLLDPEFDDMPIEYITNAQHLRSKSND